MDRSTVLTEKQRQKIIDKLASEPSDVKLADKFGISRTTVWRIRQDETTKQAKLKRAKARMKAKETNKMQTTMKPAIVPAPAPVVTAPAPVIQALPKIDPTPRVDAEPVAMGTYFAVQLLRCEHIKDVANAIMQAAESRGVLFRKLQVMDFVSVGTSSFVRFRSDLAEPATVLSGLKRGFISFAEGNYRFTFADGRQGVRFPTTIMCSVQKVGFGQTFAGPKIRRWAQQFATAS